MGAIADVMALEDQEKLDQEAAAARAVPRDPVRTNGFHKANPPESVFPKGLKATGQFRVNPDQLNSVKKQMLADLNRLQSSLAQLTNNGSNGELVCGWETALAFGSNAYNAYQAITQFMQALNSAYDLVASNVGWAAQNYSDADATTASAASRVASEASS
jgi:uncharacterized protein YukE